MRRRSLHLATILQQCHEKAPHFVQVTARCSGSCQENFAIQFQASIYVRLRGSDLRVRVPTEARRLMSEIGSINPTLAKQSPESVFQSPLDIVGEVMLTRGEKIGTLERWRATVLQQIAAADDGMRTQGVSDKLAGTLADIAKALEQLQTPVVG
jgi:hypothetical protein